MPRHLSFVCAFCVALAALTGCGDSTDADEPAGGSPGGADSSNSAGSASGGNGSGVGGSSAGSGTGGDGSTSPACDAMAPRGCEAQAPARCWYVAQTGDDAAAGTLDAPLRHIWKGVSAAQPGDFVYVRAGTWGQDEAAAYSCGDGGTQKAIIPIVEPFLYGTGAAGEDCVTAWPAFTVASGTESAPITISAFPGEHVQIDSEAGEDFTGETAFVVRIGQYLNGAHRAYWTVRGFDIHGAVFVSGNGTDDSGNPDMLANSHHIVIDSNEIHDLITPGGDNPGMVKIDRGDFGGPYEITVRCNHIHHMKDVGATSWEDTGDAQHFGAVTTLSMQFYGGVDQGGTGRIVIERNLLHDLPHAFFFKNPAEGPVEIRHNRIFATQGLGIAGSSNMTFENNLVYGTESGFDFSPMETSDPELLALSGQNAVLENNTLVGPGYGWVGSGAGHSMHGNLVFGLTGQVAGANWDTRSLLAKGEVQSDPLDIGESVLHTFSIDDNCYVSPHADFQAVARYVALGGGDFQVDHLTLDDARTTFGFDQRSTVVLSDDPAALFVNAGAHDFTAVAGSPCAAYGADLSEIPAAP